MLNVQLYIQVALAIDFIVEFVSKMYKLELYRLKR